jgi:hypothetical protein
MLLEIEIPRLILHVGNHPARNSIHQALVFLTHSGEENHRLCRAVNIDWIKAVVIIFRRPVGKKKVLAIKTNAPVIA